MQVGSCIQIANVGTKSETNPELLHNSSIYMDYIHLKDLSNK